MNWNGDRKIDSPLIRIRAHPHIVVFRFNVQAGGSHGNTFHAFSPPAAMGLFAAPRLGFHHHLFYVRTFYGDAAAHQVSAKRYRARWISKWNGNSVVGLSAQGLRQCEQRCCSDQNDVFMKLKVIVHEYFPWLLALKNAYVAI